MKIELMLEDDVCGCMTKNGVLIDIAFFVNADILRQVFVPDEEHTIEDILPDGKPGKRVHWKLSGDKWNALVKAKLAPTWYGKFTCDLHDVKASDFTDKNGNPQTSLVGQFRPIKSEEGVAVGTTSEMEIIDNRNKDEDSAEANG